MSTFATGSTSGGTKKSAGCTLSSDSIKLAWKNLRDTGDGFVVCSYKEGSGTDVEVAVERKEGGWRELKTALKQFEHTACFGGVATSSNSFSHFFYVGSGCAGAG